MASEPTPPQDKKAINEAMKIVIEGMAQKQGWVADTDAADPPQPCILYNVRDFDHSAPYGVSFGWTGDNDYYATPKYLLNSIDNEEDVPIGSVNAWLMIHIMMPCASFNHQTNQGDCYEVMIFYNHESRPKKSKRLFYHGSFHSIPDTDAIAFARLRVASATCCAAMPVIMGEGGPISRPAMSITRLIGVRVFPSEASKA